MPGTLILKVREFGTVGFSSTTNPQTEVEIVLRTLEGTMTLWHENSAAGFPRYGQAQVLPAARRYARKLGKLIGATVVTERKKT